MRSVFHLTIALLFGLAANTIGQPAISLEDLLAEAESTLARAKAEELTIISPRRVTKAEESVREARNLMGSNGSDNIVRLNLESAMESLETAESHALQARPKLQPILDAREAAKAAGAAQSNLPIWQQAEKGLIDLAGKLEQGDESELGGLKEPLSQQYYAARREALRDGFLAETKAHISAAEKAGADDAFPMLMARARQALSRAEALLAQESLDECKVSASEATRWAVHAKGQAEFAAETKSSRAPDEAMLLPYDDLLEKIATSWGDTISFADGAPSAIEQFEKLAEGHVEKEEFVKDSLIHFVSSSRQSMENSLSEMQTSLADQQNKITECEQRILDIQMERDLAVTRLRKRELTAQRAQNAQTAFDPGDAVVYQTMDGNIVIHLYGLKFPSGKATLDKNDQSILRKAAEAIEVFPDVKVVVEGHTDAEGSDDSNQQLSEERAREVGKALEKALDSKVTIETIGKGESAPIASNENARGRALNRRIDLVLTTQ